MTGGIKPAGKGGVAAFHPLPLPARSSSAKKAAQASPSLINKSTSSRTTGKLFPQVESASAALPLAGGSKARPRSTSPRKATRPASPPLPLYRDDSSGDEKDAGPSRSYVVLADGYKPRVFHKFNPARAFVKELSKLNVPAYIEGVETEDEVNSLLFGA
ncbi:hypothetical protein HDZ31DRAFT_68955 [Schizophyllum fasciatum]